MRISGKANSKPAGSVASKLYFIIFKQEKKKQVEGERSAKDTLFSYYNWRIVTLFSGQTKSQQMKTKLT